MPLAFLFSLILLRGSLKSLFPPLSWFLVANSFGISLAALGLLPLFHGALAICSFLMILLSIDNLLSFKFRWWRFAAAAVGGFLLGMVIVQSSGFTQLGGIPVTLKFLIPFQLGLFGVFLLSALLFGSLANLFSRFPFFRQYIVVPLPVIIAGIGTFLLIV